MFDRYTLNVTVNGIWIFEQTFKSLRTALFVVGGFDYSDPNVVFSIFDNLHDTIIGKQNAISFYEELFNIEVSND